MAKVGAQRAAELTGKSKSTIQRAMNNGKISFELDNNGRRVIDVSELERAFGIQKQEAPAQSAQNELEKASAMLEMERLKMRIKMLEDQLDTANGQIDDLKEQRDRWQRQADQVLITSQHSQKQADDLRAELKSRELQARQRRQKLLEERMKRMQAQNQNRTAMSETGTAQQSGGFGFKSLFKRAKA